MAIHNIKFGQKTYDIEGSHGRVSNYRDVVIQCSCGFRDTVGWIVSDMDAAVELAVIKHKVDVALSAHGLTFAVPTFDITQLKEVK